MKKVLFIIFAIAFLSCSKDNKKVITNLSGVGWYNTEVWYRDTPKGDLKGYSKVGSVSIGSSCTVSTDHPIFYIYAKDARGRMVMSQDVSFSGNSAMVRERDLY